MTSADNSTKKLRRNSGDPRDHFCLKSLESGKACMKKGFHYVTVESKVGQISTVFCKQHYMEYQNQVIPQDKPIEIKRNYMFKILKKESEGFRLMQNQKGEIYDVIAVEIITKDGRTLGDFQLDVLPDRKGGWINIFSESFEMKNSSLGRMRFKMIALDEPITNSIFDIKSKRSFHIEMREALLKHCYTLMHRGQPQVQLLAGGQILMLLEIADGLRIPIREELSNNLMCKKAFDRVVELRHFDCEALKEINKRLPQR